MQLNYVVSYIVINFFYALSPGTAKKFFVENNLLCATGIMLLTHLIYFTFCEKVFKGYTLEKLITGTRVIRADGQELTFKNSLVRSFSRLVPFEALSIWSDNGLWHDHWTNTRVIKVR